MELVNKPMDENLDRRNRGRQIRLEDGSLVDAPEGVRDAQDYAEYMEEKRRRNEELGEQVVEAAELNVVEAVELNADVEEDLLQKKLQEALFSPDAVAWLTQNDPNLTRADIKKLNNDELEIIHGRWLKEKASMERNANLLSLRTAPALRWLVEEHPEIKTYAGLKALSDEELGVLQENWAEQDKILHEKNEVEIKPKTGSEVEAEAEVDAKAKPEPDIKPEPETQVESRPRQKQIRLEDGSLVDAPEGVRDAQDYAEYMEEKQRRYQEMIEKAETKKIRLEDGREVNVPEGVRDAQDYAEYEEEKRRRFEELDKVDLDSLRNNEKTEKEDRSQNLSAAELYGDNKELYANFWNEMSEERRNEIRSGRFEVKNPYFLDWLREQGIIEVAVEDDIEPRLDPYFVV